MTSTSKPSPEEIKAELALREAEVKASRSAALAATDAAEMDKKNAEWKELQVQDLKAKGAAARATAAPVRAQASLVAPHVPPTAAASSSAKPAAPNLFGAAASSSAKPAVASHVPPTGTASSSAKPAAPNPFGASATAAQPASTKAAAPDPFGAAPAAAHTPLFGIDPKSASQRRPIRPHPRRAASPPLPLPTARGATSKKGGKRNRKKGGRRTRK